MGGIVVVDQIETMTPATSSPSRVHQAPTITQRPEENVRYHRMTYHGDRGVHIVESPKRRRSHHSSKPGAAAQQRPMWKPEGDFQLFLDPSSSSLPVDPSSQCPETGPGHVPSKSFRYRKRQVKVITEISPSSPTQLPTSPSLKIKDVMLKPPPTPRPSRLPSPDIPDLPDGAFCDCRRSPDTSKYCKCCLNAAF